MPSEQAVQKAEVDSTHNGSFPLIFVLFFMVRHVSWSFKYSKIVEEDEGEKGDMGKSPRSAREGNGS